VHILNVTNMYCLLAETHSLHVHHGCALFTTTSRISSKAEHCCELKHCGGMQQLYVVMVFLTRLHIGKWLQAL